MKNTIGILAALGLLTACAHARRDPAPSAASSQSPLELPRYSHVFVIIEENKNYAQVLQSSNAPNLTRLARDYGKATAFYGEVHPSEANYVALLGGDTFGIHDDDAFYCKPKMRDRYCGHANTPGYVDHTILARHLGQQLEDQGLRWKGYYGDLPAPGSLAVIAGSLARGGVTHAASLYASKHSGFLNFASMQSDPRRSEKIVGFDQLDRDLAADQLPNFALLIPNQCDEMHGLYGAAVPDDCSVLHPGALVRRGDRVVGELVARLQRTRAWESAENVAIVITFDEGAGGSREGCCAVTPSAQSNFGGGHVPTVVITNHGPRGAADPTPYNHYSLLRTIEDVFGIGERLGHAADEHLGVRSMTPLFGVPPKVTPVRPAARPALPSGEGYHAPPPRKASLQPSFASGASS